jgi:hypothetical protein
VNIEPGSLPTAENKPLKLRWYQPTPGRLLIVLLAVEGALLLAERFQWFAFNRDKGWTVLIAIAGVLVAMGLLFLWFVLALCFRWRFQFSLRSLLALAVVVAIPFSWLAVEMKKAREQREAVEAIREQRGFVIYDYHVEGIPSYSGPEMRALPGPIWLRRILGDDFFSTVLGATVENTRLTDTGLDRMLERLRRLPRLLWVTLAGKQVTNASLEHLKGLTRLQDLSLNNTQVTDAGLVHLKGLTKLQRLNLDETQVTDAGLGHLKGLTQLDCLFLGNTHVTDNGVKDLQQALPNCDIRR